MGDTRVVLNTLVQRLTRPRLEDDVTEVVVTELGLPRLLAHSHKEAEDEDEKPEDVITKDKKEGSNV